jgi:hypothetical protein
MLRTREKGSAKSEGSESESERSVSARQKGAEQHGGVTTLAECVELHCHFAYLVVLANFPSTRSHSVFSIASVDHSRKKKREKDVLYSLAPIDKRSATKGMRKGCE